jgi:hypothetical protein
MKTKLRNSAARSPLLRKGGVHEKSKSGQRSRDKVKLKHKLSEFHQTGLQPRFFCTISAA